jgi:UDP-N-acetylglucosamine transferase subunit ALG13
MIFVTVGTHQQPFHRLMHALEALPADELFVQYGHASPPPGVARAVAFQSFPEMLEAFAKADVVVTHAGVGSILCATNAGHIPVVVPRLKQYGEHVDDHQVHLIRELERDGRVRVVWEMDELAETVAAAPPRRPPVQRRPGPLQASVKAALIGTTVEVAEGE